MSDGRDRDPQLYAEILGCDLRRFKRVVVQFAPAVRVALGDEFGLEPGTNVAGKIVGALRKGKWGWTRWMTPLWAPTYRDGGIQRVCERNIKRGSPLTSCCPAWVKYAEHAHPGVVEQISTCKSPMQIFSAVIRSISSRCRRWTARNGGVYDHALLG